MVTTLVKRIERAEQVDGGDGACERCRDTLVVTGVGGEITVHKDNTTLTSEAAKAFYQAEMPNGQCPACGNFRHKVVMRWGPNSGGWRHNR